MYLNILLTVTSIAIVVLVVYLIRLFTQLQKTLKSIDELARQINIEVTKVDETIENLRLTSANFKDLTKKVADFSFLKVLMLVRRVLESVQFVRTFKKKRNKKTKEDEKPSS